MPKNESSGLHGSADLSCSSFFERRTLASPPPWSAYYRAGRRTLQGDYRRLGRPTGACVADCRASVHGAQVTVLRVSPKNPAPAWSLKAWELENERPYALRVMCPEGAVRRSASHMCGNSSNQHRVAAAARAEEREEKGREDGRRAHRPSTAPKSANVKCRQPIRPDPQFVFVVFRTRVARS